MVTNVNLTAFTDLILYYFNLYMLYYWSNWTEYFLAYIIIISYTTSKNPDCKIQISAKKNVNLRYFVNIFLI